MPHLFKDALIRRIGRNFGLLVSGNGVAALLALASLAVAARGLGSETFGLLMLVHAYAMVVAGLTRFNVYHAIIRYGAALMRPDTVRDFQRLVVFGLAVEIVGIALGAVLGVAGLGWLGTRLGVPAAHQGLALGYCLIVIVSGATTPTGILRLLDRFDLVGMSRPLTPALRTLGCLLAWAAAAPLPVFAAIWALAGTAEALLLWTLAFRTLRRQGWLAAMRLELGGRLEPFPGLIRMVLWTNLQASLGLISGRLVTLIVGAMLGPTAAGLYLVAHQAASVIARPLQMARRAVEPEFARLVASAERSTLTRLHRRMILVTAGFAFPLLLLLAFLGEDLLAFVVGEAFRAAHPVMVLLAFQTALLMLVLPSASLLVMLGRAGWLLAAQLASRMVQVAALPLLLPAVSLPGAGMAGVAAAVLELALVAGLTVRSFNAPVGRPAEPLGQASDRARPAAN